MNNNKIINEKYLKKKLNGKLITISDSPLSGLLCFVPCVVLIESDEKRVMTPLGL